jgi:hypothetical protein
MATAIASHTDCTFIILDKSDDFQVSCPPELF